MFNFLNKFKSVKDVAKATTQITGYISNREAPPVFDSHQFKSIYSSWISACVNANAVEASSYDFKIMAKDNGQKCLWDYKKSIDNYIQIDDDSHPFFELISHPSDIQSKSTFLQTIFAFLQLTGNAYIYVVKDNNGLPIALLPLYSQYVTVKNSNQTFIDGYYYGEGNKKKFFKKDEIIHIKTANPLDFYYGRSKIEDAWVVGCLNKELKIQRYSFFKNSARPDHLVVAKTGNESALKRFESKLKSIFRGSSNSGNFISVAGDVDIKPLQFSPKDMGEQDLYIIKEIASIFGTPIYKLLGNSEIKANTEAQDEDWIRSTIYPYMILVEEAFTDYFQKVYGWSRDVRIVFENPIPEDENKLIEKSIKLFKDGLITRAEARLIIGYDANDDDNKYIGDYRTPQVVEVPKQEEKSVSEKVSDNINLTFNTITGDVMPEQPSLKYLEDKEEDKSEVVNFKEEEETKEVESYKTAVESFFEKMDDEKMKYSEDNNIYQMELGLSKVLSDIETNLVQLMNNDPDIEKEINSKSIDNFYSRVGAVVALYDTDIKRVITDHFKRIMAIGGKEGLVQIGLDESTWTINNPKIQEYLDDYIPTLSGQVLETTKEDIIKAISEGIERGDSINQITKDIQEISAFSRQRAEKIARTESAVAYVEGEQLAWKESGVVQGKQWLIQQNACPFCQEMRNKNIDLDDNYFAKGDNLTTNDGKEMKLDFRDIDGPPLHVNCRCDLIPILKDN